MAEEDKSKEVLEATEALKEASLGISQKAVLAALEGHAHLGTYFAAISSGLSTGGDVGEDDFISMVTRVKLLEIALIQTAVNACVEENEGITKPQAINNVNALYDAALYAAIFVWKDTSPTWDMNDLKAFYPTIEETYLNDEIPDAELNPNNPEDLLAAIQSFDEYTAASRKAKQEDL